MWWSRGENIQDFSAHLPQLYVYFRGKKDLCALRLWPLSGFTDPEISLEMESFEETHVIAVFHILLAYTLGIMSQVPLTVT